jgi:hypothetical protein
MPHRVIYNYCRKAVPYQVKPHEMAFVVAQSLMKDKRVFKYGSETGFTF